MAIALVGILGMICAGWLGAMIFGVAWRKDRAQLDEMWEEWKKGGRV